MYSSTGAKATPILDETGFQQLLAAAYVLQQHNDSLRAKEPRLDPTWIFGQISETEALVRDGNLAPAGAAELITAKLSRMTGAVSASVWRLNGDALDCLAHSSITNSTPGRSIAWLSQAAVERLRNGRQFQSVNAQVDPRLDPELSRDLGVHSLLAVPVSIDEELAGLIEIHWGLPDALHECDVRTCRLMADLLAELISRDAGEHEGFPQEPGTAFSPLPSPDSKDAHELRPWPVKANESELAPQQSDPASDVLASACRVCGRAFHGEEAFCANCSMPRVASSTSDRGLQSKWASMWFMQKAQATSTQEETPKRDPKPLEHFAPLQASPHLFHEDLPVTMSVSQLETSSQSDGSVVLESLPVALTTAPHVYDDVAVTGSKSEPVELASEKSINVSALWSRFRSGFPLHLRISRRAVGLTAVLVTVVFFLSIWASMPAGAGSQLTWFESILVELGLAEVPQRAAPIYAGSPDVRVWEDVHTALYYCEGSELYGKTPGGRFSTQRSAQQDQFESATRVPCQ